MPPRHPGVGPRIEERLRVLGYVRESDGQPDVTRFTLDHRYNYNMFFEWLKDRSTPEKHLERLCKDLGVSPSWLLFGAGPPPERPRRPRRPHPISGGSDAAGTPSGDSRQDELSLIGRWLTRLWWFAQPWHPTLAWA